MPNANTPPWLPAAETAAADRLASIQIPPDSVVLMLSRDEVAQLIRDTVVWAYGRGRAEAGCSSTSSH